MIISIKVTLYRNLGQSGLFPNDMEIVRYVDGKVDTSTTVRLGKIVFGEKALEPQEPDRSKAVTITDCRNDVPGSVNTAK